MHSERLKVQYRREIIRSCNR